MFCCSVDSDLAFHWISSLFWSAKSVSWIKTREAGVRTLSAIVRTRDLILGGQGHLPPSGFSRGKIYGRKVVKSDIFLPLACRFLENKWLTTKMRVIRNFWK